MADSKQQLIATGEQNVQTLDNTMKMLPYHMRIFSVALRSLYAEKAVSSSVSKKINRIRDDTRKDAMVYVNGILPMSTTLVRSIKEFFEYYVELDKDEWIEELPSILDEVRGYKQCCNAVVLMHESIMVPLKQREDEAKVLMKEMKELSAVYNKEKEQLLKKADSKYSWAFALAFVPGVNLIASPLLLMSSDTALAEAVAKGVQTQLSDAAVVVVSETMIPALGAFIDGLRASAGFFSIIEQELMSFQTKGEKAQINAKSLHYKMMKKYANSITNSCLSFYEMIPDVRTDFLAIPTDGTDKNYVDKWLEKQKEEISKKYKYSLTGQLRLMLFSEPADKVKAIKH